MVYFLFVHYSSKVVSVTNIHVETNILGFKHKTQSKYKNHGNSKYAAQKILIRKNLASIFRISLPCYITTLEEGICFCTHWKLIWQQQILLCNKRPIKLLQMASLLWVIQQNKLGLYDPWSCLFAIKTFNIKRFTWMSIYPHIDKNQ